MISFENVFIYGTGRDSIVIDISIFKQDCYINAYWCFAIVL